MDYIVIDYTKYGYEADKVKIYRVNEKELFEWLDRAKDQELLISVYKLGECILDWS